MEKKSQSLVEKIVEKGIELDDIVKHIPEIWTEMSEAGTHVKLALNTLFLNKIVNR